MEILMLVLLYYLSQNPNFSESVQPLMAQIKDSEQMLNFLKDLSKFSQTFGGLKMDHPQKSQPQPTTSSPKQEEEKQNPQSPTKGIADEFIQNILDNYLKTS